MKQTKHFLFTENNQVSKMSKKKNRILINAIILILNKVLSEKFFDIDNKHLKKIRVIVNDCKF